MREVRVYDGAFSTAEPIRSLQPSLVFPRSTWLQQVQLGEFAVRYKDFKTGLARAPSGDYVQSSEICRIFGSLEEARANSREVVTAHWTVRCFIYDRTGRQIEAISNKRKVRKFAIDLYAPVVGSLAIFAFVGIGLMWLLGKVIPSIGWVEWIVSALLGLLLGILAWYLHTRSVIERRVDRMHGSVTSNRR